MQINLACLTDLRIVLGTQCVLEPSTYLDTLTIDLTANFSVIKEKLTSDVEKYGTQSRETSVSLTLCLKQKRIPTNFKVKAFIISLLHATGKL